MAGKPSETEMVDHLFRHEAGKMVAVLTKVFGFDQLEVAEDLVQDTFLKAYETWRIKGIPEKPVAWLYTVAKNKATDKIRRSKKYQDIQAELSYSLPAEYTIIANLENAFHRITDNQLKMLFSICHPAIPGDSQVALALKTLCGFSTKEIARAFLTGAETIEKRLYRARQKIRQEKLEMEMPPSEALRSRLEGVIQCLYLLFNEGYYSASKDTVIRKDLCLEAMRLTLLLLENAQTGRANVQAFMALMCFHASRFESRISQTGDLIPMKEQDRKQWDQELIGRGLRYLEQSKPTQQLSPYHVEAMIAWNHTRPDTPEKWTSLHQLYDRLIEMKPGSVVAMNRAMVLSKASTLEAGIEAAEAISGMEKNYLWHTLLGELYRTKNPSKARHHVLKALDLAPLEPEKQHLRKKLNSLK